MTEVLTRWILPSLVLAAVTAAIYAGTRAMVDPDAEERNERLSAELARVRARNEHLREQVQARQTEVTRLTDTPAERLYHARTRLGLVRPGEVIYQLDPPSDAPVAGEVQ